MPRAKSTNSVVRKTKKVRIPLRLDEKYTGSEPTWDTEAAKKLSDSEFDNKLRRSFYYYNYYYNVKDAQSYVVEYMQKSGDYTNEQIRRFVNGSDKNLTMTACSLAMAAKAGMPLRERHMEYIKNVVAKCIGAGVIEEPKPTTQASPVFKPTIQDRLHEKTCEQIGEIEGMYDCLITDKKVDFKPYDYLVTNKVPQAQLSKFEDVFVERRKELELAQDGQDDQLNESYKHYKSSDYKRFYGFIDGLLEAIEQYRNIKKAAKKAKIKKAPSKEKVVSKLKFAKEDRALKLVSINPADIVGAQELWVYNIKTRKLGKYVAAAYSTLSVKGTTILNFDESKSVAKNLRKPAEQLREFNRAGKVALRTFLKDLKAVEVKMNGRINKDTVLLKVA